MDGGVSVLAEADAVVVATDHSAFEWRAVVKHARLVLDTRNALRGLDGANIVRL
jgi:UDP-N-acetyl-D-glucosamine dehydrogenase